MLIGMRRAATSGCGPAFPTGVYFSGATPTYLISPSRH
jgi:hypothetical protein